MRLGFFSIAVVVALALVPGAAAYSGVYVVVEKDGKCIIGIEGPVCTILDKPGQGYDVRFGAIIVCGQVGSQNHIGTGSDCEDGDLRVFRAIRTTS